MPRTKLKHIFEPLQIGPMRIRNRIMLPPHASAAGNLWGSKEDATRHIGCLAARVESGAAWVTSITG